MCNMFWRVDAARQKHCNSLMLANSAAIETKAAQDSHAQLQLMCAACTIQAAGHCIGPWMQPTCKGFMAAPDSAFISIICFFRSNWLSVS